MKKSLPLDEVFKGCYNWKNMKLPATKFRKEPMAISYFLKRVFRQ